MSEKGAIFLHRQIQDHYLWKDKPFTMGQAWIDMLLRANHEAARVLYGREFYEIDRGQFIRTERDLAHDWGWSRSKVTRFLVLLKNDSMIDTKPNPKANLITILNYNDYQILRTNNKPKLNQNRTNSEPIVNLNNNEKNEKNEKNKRIYIQPLLGTFQNVKLTQEDLEKLQTKYGDFEQRIERLSKYIASKGDKYKSHYATILNWAEKDKEDGNGKTGRAPKPDGFNEKRYVGSDLESIPWNKDHDV